MFLTCCFWPRWFESWMLFETSSVTPQQGAYSLSHRTTSQHCSSVLSPPSESGLDSVTWSELVELSRSVVTWDWVTKDWLPSCWLSSFLSDWSKSSCCPHLQKETYQRGAGEGLWLRFREALRHGYSPGSLEMSLPWLRPEMLTA